LSFVSTATARRHDEADLSLAEELGRRVAGVVEADRVATRERQLHAGTVALAAAGTLAEAAAALSSAVTSALGAAGTAIYVVGPDDLDLHLIHSAGYPPQIASSFARIRADADLPAAVAARTRTGVWLGEQRAWLGRYPQMAVPGAAEDVHALTALHLIMGERVVGVLAASFPTGRAFPSDERGFAATLAALAAQAFERAAHSDAQESIARTLQRSLLPARLPTPPRLALAARYLPAGQHTQAGGDWYDVITLDEDRVAIVVGDVVGNGPAAAAVMGQLRSALGFLLKNNQSPAVALSWLSRYAHYVPAARGSSAIAMVLHPATGELFWARAGHPPPLLMDPTTTPGQARYLEDAHGPVLGFLDTRPSHMPYTEGHLVLTPGASVLLYTDGLVERRGEVIDDGLDRLAATAASHLNAAPEALVPVLLDAGLAGAGPTDDVALIVARLLPAALRHRAPAVPSQLPVLRRTVTAWATAAALPALAVEDLQLALGEAVANTAEHAYRNSSPGKFTYQLDRTPDGAVQVEVRDEGTWRPPPADPGYRGRGLALIDVLGEDVTVDTTGPGTCIRFTVPARPADAVADAVAEAIPSDPVSAWVDTSVELRSEPDPDGATTLYLGGAIDLTTIEARRTELLDMLHRTPGEIVLDTCDVTYLASAGVGLLLEAIQVAAGRVRLHMRAGSPTARILALTGLDDVATQARTQQPATDQRN
jgi:anti-anti-sigma factor